jgi:hypothetical protein
MKITVKKTRAICGGQAQIHGPTYGPTLRPDMKDLRLFFALVALENKLIYGAGVSNAFAVVSAAPVQQYFMQVDVQFRDWWFATLVTLIISFNKLTSLFLLSMLLAFIVPLSTRLMSYFFVKWMILPLPLTMNSFTPKFATLFTPTSLYP